MRAEAAIFAPGRVIARAHWRPNGDHRLELDFGEFGETLLRRDQLAAIKSAIEEFERRQMFEDNHDRINPRTEGLGEF